MRERFCALLHATDTYLNSFIENLEHLVDSRDQEAVTKLFTSMARDNMVKAHPPKYAAGTGFASTLLGLATLSRTATESCTREMAAAALDIHNSASTSEFTPTPIGDSTTTENSDQRNESAPDPNNPRLARGAPASDPLAPYLAAARRPAKPRKVNRIAPVTSENHTPAAADGDTPKSYTARLRAQANRMTNTWLGHETKNLLLITSDAPQASPTHLRQILSFGGVDAPMAILPTNDSTKALACAADSALDSMKHSYDTFIDVCRTSRRKPPRLTFTKITEANIASANATETRLLLHAIRKEVTRLESASCTWRPRPHFALRLREIEKSTYTRCTVLEGETAPAPFPDNPHTQRPNKRIRSAMSSASNDQNQDEIMQDDESQHAQRNASPSPSDA